MPAKGPSLQVPAPPAAPPRTAAPERPQQPDPAQPTAAGRPGRPPTLRARHDSSREYSHPAVGRCVVQSRQYRTRATICTGVGGGCSVV